MLFNVYNPIAFEIFGFTIRWYALFITLGMVAAIIFATRFTKYRKGLKSENVLDVALLAIPLGVLGARVFSVLTDPKQPNTIAQIFNFSGGGLSIIGAIIGGAIGFAIICWIRKINFLKFLDIIVPCLLFAQGIGRWGNFMNQEVYGMQVAANMQWFPFAVFIERGGLNEWRQALFFYEFVWNMAGFALLYVVLRKIKTEGIVGFGYFLWYGLGRSIMEGMRDPEFNLGVNTMVSRVFSIGMAVLGVVGILIVLGVDKGIIFKKRNAVAASEGNAAATGEDIKTAELVEIDIIEKTEIEQTEKDAAEEAAKPAEKIAEEAAEEKEERQPEYIKEEFAQEEKQEEAPQPAKIRLVEEIIIPKDYVPEARIVDQDELDRISAELDAIEKTYIRTRPYVPPVKPAKPAVKTAPKTVPKTAPKKAPAKAGGKSAKPAAKTGTAKPAKPAAKTGTAKSAPAKPAKPAVKTAPAKPAKAQQAKKPSAKSGKKDE